MLNDRDYELLSAYLDGALSPAERSQLEQRLQDDAALRRELTALRQTVALLRDLPPLRAPRDFTLTRAQVRPPRVLFLPATTLVTVVSAAAAFVLVALGVLLLTLGRPVSAPSMTMQTAPQDEGAAVAELPSPTPFATAATEETAPDDEADQAEAARSPVQRTQPPRLDEAGEAPPGALGGAAGVTATQIAEAFAATATREPATLRRDDATITAMTQIFAPSLDDAAGDAPPPAPQAAESTFADAPEAAEAEALAEQAEEADLAEGSTAAELAQAATATPSPPPTATASPTATDTATPSITPSVTPSITPSATASPTPIPSVTPTFTPTPRPLITLPDPLTPVHLIGLTLLLAGLVGALVAALTVLARRG